MLCVKVLTPIITLKSEDWPSKLCMANISEGGRVFIIRDWSLKDVGYSLTLRISNHRIQYGILSAHLAN